MSEKEIPVEEMKVAVKSLNAILESGKIKTVGRKKVEIIQDFAAKVNEFIEADKAVDLPDDAIEFFNTYIATEEGDDTPEEKPAEKKSAGKKGSEKKSTEKKPAKEKGEAPVRVGILDAIFSEISKGGCTKADILASLKKQFPDRDEKGMKNTINCQLTGKNRPWRLEKSKKCSFVLEDGKYRLEEAKKSAKK